MTQCRPRLEGVKQAILNSEITAIEDAVRIANDYCNAEGRDGDFETVAPEGVIEKLASRVYGLVNAEEKAEIAENMLRCDSHGRKSGEAQPDIRSTLNRACHPAIVRYMGWGVPYRVASKWHRDISRARIHVRKQFNEAIKCGKAEMVLDPSVGKPSDNPSKRWNQVVETDRTTFKAMIAADQGAPEILSWSKHSHGNVAARSTRRRRNKEKEDSGNTPGNRPDLKPEPLILTIMILYYKTSY